MKTPKISIIIPTYNSEKYIIAAIESCLNQSYKDIEVIIVDDGSVDNTASVIATIVETNTNVRYYYQFNQGACVARNRGLAESKGIYIKFLDADDVLESNVLEKQITAAVNVDNKTIIYGNYNVVNENCELMEAVDLSKKYTSDRTIFSHFDWNIGTSTALILKEELMCIKGFDVSLPFAQESDLLIRLAANGNSFVHMPIICYLNRQHHSPSRIRNSANYTEYWVFLKLMRKYKKLLEDSQQYTMKENENMINYFLFKISGYYQLHNFKDAKQALVELTRYKYSIMRNPNTYRKILYYKLLTSGLSVNLVYARNLFKKYIYNCK